MPRRPADYTAQIQADDQRRRQQAEQRRKDDDRRKQLNDRQASAYGTVVIAAANSRFDIDQLAGLLLEALERADADRQLPEVWRQRGQAFFRVPAHGNGRAAPAAPHESARDQRGDGGDRSGAAASPDQPAPELGRDAAARAADLLGGLAPDRPGAQPPKAG